MGHTGEQVVEEVVVVATNQEGAREKGEHASVPVATDLDVRVVRKPPEHDREPESAEPDWQGEEEPCSSAFVKIENAFDKRAIVSRQPDGARPNKPMTAMLGVEWVF